MKKLLEKENKFLRVKFLKDSFFESFKILESQSFNFKRAKPIRRVVFCGMGGSGLGARLFLSLKEDFSLKIPFKLVQDFDDFKLKPSDLVIAVSYSGNTKETLAFASKAFAKKTSLVILTSGAKLLDFALKNKIYYFLLPKEILPRDTVFFQFFFLGGILEGFKILNFRKRILKLRNLKFDLKKNSLLASKIAQKIGKKIVVIYATSKTEFFGYHLKTFLEEDALTFTSLQKLPEALHNNFLTLKFFNKEKIFVIFLKAFDDFPFNKKIITLMAQEFQKWGLNFKEIFLKEKDKLKRAFFQIIFNTLIALNLKELKKINSNYQRNFLKQFKAKI